MTKRQKNKKRKILSQSLNCDSVCWSRLKRPTKCQHLRCCANIHSVYSIISPIRFARSLVWIRDCLLLLPPPTFLLLWTYFLQYYPVLKNENWSVQNQPADSFFFWCNSYLDTPRKPIISKRRKEQSVYKFLILLPFDNLSSLVFLACSGLFEKSLTIVYFVCDENTISFVNYILQKSFEMEY